MMIFHSRRDYLKALHLDPLCLSARVNLGYNLQVRQVASSVDHSFRARQGDITKQMADKGTISRYN